MTFGGRPEDIATFYSLGGSDDERLLGFLDLQLAWSSIDDSEFETRLSALGYQTLEKTLEQQWLDHHVNLNSPGFNRAKPIEEMEHLVVARAMHSKRQLLEVLADFWHNHFNIFGHDFYSQSVFTSWDRDVIRPPVSGHPRENGLENGHLLGNFRQLLQLSSRHVAMQYYLDNYINQVAGPNENYAREVMERHTLGAENYVPLVSAGSIAKTSIPLPWGAGGTDIMMPIANKYVDNDVYSAMRMLTGWKIKDDSSQAHSNFQDTGAAFFYEPWHDKFEKTILGKHWGNNEYSPEDILEFFDVLAYHPGTARHIAGKLCRRFVSGDPEPSVIDAVANTFYQNRYAADQLEQTYRTLFQSAEFKAPANYGKIFKRPLEAMISAMRICGSEYTPAATANSPASAFVYYFLQYAGQRPFFWLSPDGFPDDEQHWQGSNSLLYVMRFMDWLGDYEYATEDRMIAILNITLSAHAEDLPLHSPNALVTFWLSRILGYAPDGGWLGTPLHTQLTEFMSQNPADSEIWPADTAFSDISDTTYPLYLYERLRSLVALILSSSEFLHR